MQPLPKQFSLKLKFSFTPKGLQNTEQSNVLKSMILVFAIFMGVC